MSQHTDDQWRSRALCRNFDPDDWFPVGTTGPALDQTTEAKQVCRRCPVTVPCLAEALADLRLDGIWAGTTHDERREFLRNVRAGRIEVSAGC